MSSRPRDEDDGDDGGSAGSGDNSGKADEGSVEDSNSDHEDGMELDSSQDSMRRRLEEERLMEADEASPNLDF